VASTLSVVIPYYNEPDWIRIVVADLMAAVERSPFELADLIIVDDGSGEAGRAALERLAREHPVRIVRQENAGRFIARITGIEATAGELVLLLDSRVSIRPDALSFVAAELERTGDAPVWTADVDQDLTGNPFARLIRLMEFLAWRDYMATPRTVSFGLEEFDRYPKGTTCFLAPRQLLLDAIAEFTTMYEDLREANDDTVLIRSIANRAPINISPGFSCLYRPRRAARPFVRHTYHRGSVFVDGYARPGTRFFAVIAAFYPASLLTVALAARHPLRTLRLSPVVMLAAAGAGYSARRSRADAAAVAAVGPVWLLAYALGMWRGLALALMNRVRRA
jgi:glycosyltransferase involved in cell wall biosynthesis